MTKDRIHAGSRTDASQAKGRKRTDSRTGSRTYDSKQNTNSRADGAHKKTNSRTGKPRQNTGGRSSDRSGRRRNASEDVFGGWTVSGLRGLGGRSRSVQRASEAQLFRLLRYWLRGKGSAWLIIPILICALAAYQPQLLRQAKSSAQTVLVQHWPQAASWLGLDETDESKLPDGIQIDSAAALQASRLPPYSGKPYVVINRNVPFFSEEELAQRSAFEYYSPLDKLGRCGPAVACIGQELMPTEKRESIGQVKPSGWQYSKYDFVDGKYLYNRCHLIAFQLTGENANPRNLITGTRYLNTEGMLPFENETAEYIRAHGGHVLYRVTPIFTGDNLLADGVLMEASSLEDGGQGLRFCVYIYNVQPGVSLNYADGSNTGA